MSLCVDATSLRYGTGLISTVLMRSLSLRSFVFFFSSRRRHTRLTCDWSSDVCSSDLAWADGDGGPDDDGGGEGLGRRRPRAFRRGTVGEDAADAVRSGDGGGALVDHAH